MQTNGAHRAMIELPWYDLRKSVRGRGCLGISHFKDSDCTDSQAHFQRERWILRPLLCAENQKLPGGAGGSSYLQLGSAVIPAQAETQNVESWIPALCRNDEPQFVVLTDHSCGLSATLVLFRRRLYDINVKISQLTIVDT